MSKSSVIEISIDNPTNSPLLFRPIKQKVRGGFSFHRVREPMAAQKSGSLPGPIPGQRIGFNLETGEGYIYDPLHEKQHAALAKAIETKLRRSIPPERVTYKSAHRPTWLFWMQRLVASGKAQLTTGEFPADLGGEPQTDYLTKKRVSPIEQLTTAINALLGHLVPAAAVKN